MPKLDALGIVSKDLAASARFYRLLGVDVPEPDGDHLEATLPNGLRLMFDDVKLIQQLDPSREEPRGGHRVGLAFLCDSPAEVDETYQRVLDAGYRGKDEPFDAFWGQRYATVVDPDDNAVDLFAPL